MYITNYFRTNNKLEPRYGYSNSDSGANIFLLNTYVSRDKNKDENINYNISIFFYCGKSQ
jgi:hypothetical protein